MLALTTQSVFARLQSVKVPFDVFTSVVAKQAETFAYIVDYYNIPVICYGLKTDFKGELFEGSRRLIELCDVIEEIPTVCWCGCKAKFNARISEGKVLRDGEQVQLGGNESYVGLCRKHYMEGVLSEENRNNR